MIKFKKYQLHQFFNIIKKYMKVRSIGFFQTQKVNKLFKTKEKDLSASYLAKIICGLNIPVYEVVDYIEDDYVDHLVMLIRKNYKL